MSSPRNHPLLPLSIHPPFPSHRHQLQPGIGIETRTLHTLYSGRPLMHGNGYLWACVTMWIQRSSWCSRRCWNRLPFIIPSCHCFWIVIKFWQGKKGLWSFCIIWRTVLVLVRYPFPFPFSCFLHCLCVVIRDVGSLRMDQCCFGKEEDMKNKKNSTIQKHH